MGKWKKAFLKSIDSEFESAASFEYGPPATEAQLAGLERTISAKIPGDLRELLQEFNGVTREGLTGREEFYFSTKSMPEAAEYYRNWDCDTKLAMRQFSNVLLVCQENGMSEMWGVVVKPFATYKYGDVVSFDHDRLMFNQTETDLFAVNYENLLEMVEATTKDAGEC
jgi:hypothetical protein